jgi:hypothetical protein
MRFADMEMNAVVTAIMHMCGLLAATAQKPPPACTPVTDSSKHASKQASTPASTQASKYMRYIAQNKEHQQMPGYNFSADNQKSTHS